MLRLPDRLALALLLGFAALDFSGLPAWAQADNFRVVQQAPDVGNTMTGNVIGQPRGYQAGVLSLPPPDPYYPGYPGYYPNWLGPAGGYLSGASDVISAQGQFIQDVQKRNLMEQQVKQSKIDTRHKALNEYLWERQVLPTQEDERERDRMEQLRRSRNDPPSSEIWSGLALNNLLLATQQMQIQKGPGPTVPIEQDILPRINVTSGTTTGQAGLLRDGGRLRWPLVLKRSVFAADRQRLDELMQQAAQQARSGSIDADTLQGMTDAVDNLSAAIKTHIDDFTATEYSQAKVCLREIKSTIRALQDPNVANYVTGKWVARGNTVEELVDDMTRQGLKFAAAIRGDEPAYTALYRDMVAYYVWPSKSQAWDPVAK
jgi:hypothetical protein